MRARSVTAVVFTASLALVACTPGLPQEGPLAGSRVAPHVVGICAPRAEGADNYFSEQLTNKGKVPVQITGVTAVDLDQASVEFFVDVNGPALGQILGTFAWPTSDPIGPEREVLSRLQVPEGSEIAPGATAALYVKVSPKSASDDAVVNETKVTYKSGDHEYSESIFLEFKVPSAGVC